MMEDRKEAKRKKERKSVFHKIDVCRTFVNIV